MAMNAPVDVIDARLARRYALGKDLGETTFTDDTMLFSRKGMTNFPRHSHAAWFMAQYVRCRYLKELPDTKAIAQKLILQDLYREVAAEIADPRPRGQHDAVHGETRQRTVRPRGRGRLPEAVRRCGVSLATGSKATGRGSRRPRAQASPPWQRVGWSCALPGPCSRSSVPWRCSLPSGRLPQARVEAIYLSDRIVVMSDGPRAGIREVERVDLPRPRDKRAIFHDPRYADLKDRLIELLAGGARVGAA